MLSPPRRLISLLALATAGLAGGCAPAPVDDAARVAGAIEQRWPVWRDAERGRDVPVRLFLPAAATVAAPVPLIVFSHGVGESILSYEYLGRHWAGRGYAVMFVEHAGSDVYAVDWSEVTPSLIRAARDPANWIQRPRDLSFALDQLAADEELRGRIDWTRIAAAGHSLGAHGALALAGMRFDPGEGVSPLLGDTRIDVCLALSPPGEGMLGLTSESWGGIATPLLVVYGSNDRDIILKDAAARRAVFDGAVDVERWLAVLEGVEHETFTGRDPAFPFVSRAPQQQALIAAVTTNWLDAYLRDDAAARLRLRDGGAAVLCAGACSAEFAEAR